MDISVVIPAFNEEKIIKNTIAEVKDFLKNNFSSFEIIVVDDKSKDSTLKIVQAISGISVLGNSKNHGKGYSVVKGVKAAQGDLILFMDADNSTRINELQNFLSQTKDYPILIASRALPDSDIKIKQNVIKDYFGKFGNAIIRFVLLLRIHDTQCGFKLFSKETKHLFNKITINGFAFDFELLFLAKKYKFRVKEMPVTWLNNFDSAVKWYDYPNTLLQVFKVRFNNLIGKYN
ncbi:glycosyltransferase family 2 protein [bacterium]|nr:glycosyltransferase family 2 protein [bacterium]